MDERFLGAIWTRIDKIRRISIPSCYGPIARMYVGIITSNTVSDSRYLIICDDKGKEHHQKATAYSFQILRTSKRRRLTLPNAACASFGLRPNTGVWLVGQGNHIELWSEDAWDREQIAAFEEYTTGRKGEDILRGNCEK